MSLIWKPEPIETFDAGTYRERDLLGKDFPTLKVSVAVAIALILAIALFAFQMVSVNR